MAERAQAVPAAWTGASGQPVSDPDPGAALQAGPKPSVPDVPPAKSTLRDGLTTAHSGARPPAPVAPTGGPADQAVPTPGAATPHRPPQDRVTGTVLPSPVPGTRSIPAGTGAGATAADGVELRMDPDGPQGPLPPQGGAVKSKLLRLASSGAHPYAGSLSMAPFEVRSGPLAVGGELIAYLTWSSSAAACTLHERPASISGEEPVAFAFPNLPPAGSAALVLPKRTLDPGANFSPWAPAAWRTSEGVPTEFELDCGGLIDRLTASFDRVEAGTTLNHFLGDGGMIFSNAVAGEPVRVDLKVAVRDTPFAFTDGPGKPVLCAPTYNGPEACKVVVVWSALNALQCATDAAPNAQVGAGNFNVIGGLPLTGEQALPPFSLAINPEDLGHGALSMSLNQVNEHVERNGVRVRCYGAGRLLIEDHVAFGGVE